MKARRADSIETIRRFTDDMTHMFSAHISIAKFEACSKLLSIHLRYLFSQIEAGIPLERLKKHQSPDISRLLNQKMRIFEHSDKSFYDQVLCPLQHMGSMDVTKALLSQLQKLRPVIIQQTRSVEPLSKVRGHGLRLSLITAIDNLLLDQILFFFLIYY